MKKLDPKELVAVLPEREDGPLYWCTGGCLILSMGKRDCPRCGSSMELKP